MFSSNTTQVSSGGYQISRSLRFNRSDSAYLTRTPSSTGSRTTYTLSFWTKLGNLATGADSFMWSSGDTTVGDAPALLWKTFSGTCTFIFTAGASTDVTTSAVYRDPSAWYHIVVVVDTTQATSTNRIKMYVNGVQVTFSSATYPSQNLSYNVNTSSYPAYLGALNISGSPARYYEGYQTEVNFIDGQALTPSSFGETNAQTGVWQPKAYSGSYGTNGFYLNFSDNSNTTAATLGKDYSGNGNNWTPNNFSVTAGAGNDSLVDSPTSYGTDTGVGGTVRGNYCTLNPLTTTAGTYTQGNLRYTGPTSWRRSNATISRATGQWYWEVTLGNAPFPVRLAGEYNAFGFGLATTFGSTDTPPVQTDALVLADNGYYKNFSGSWTDGGTAFSSGNVLSIAVDLDANTFTFRRNNTSIATGTIGGTAGRELVPIIISYNGDYGVMDCNFGQRPFAYTAPSGYKALCTQNLPTPTIGATSATLAGNYFGVNTYTGTGTTQTIMNSGFQPDLVWLKIRSASSNHVLINSISGYDKYLQSSSTAVENTSTDQFLSFNSNGFTLGANAGAGGNTNQSGSTYVGWQWRASNATAVTNTSGTITSSVSANTTSGFSVVTYTGTGANATVGHGLGAVPKMMIVKGRSTAYNWRVYHVSTGNDGCTFLNTTAAYSSNSAIWNATTPTSTVFSIGTDVGVNESASTNVAYVFAEVAGYSKFGSYTGNGSADGPFVFCGFKPAYFLAKNITDGGNWNLYDNTRGPYNLDTPFLLPNSSAAEYTGAIDLVSNGVKIRTDDSPAGSNINQSGKTYIFAAFASVPLKFSLAR